MLQKQIIEFSNNLQLIKNHFGENHPVYACGLNNLALMYKSLEDYDEAALYYDKALQVYEDVYFMIFFSFIDLWKES